MTDLPSALEAGKTEQQEQEILDSNDELHTSTKFSCPSQKETTTTTTTRIVPSTRDDEDGGSSRRLMRFACFAFMFWLVVLFLVYEHEERVLILVLVALCLVLIYLTVSICFMIGTTPEFRDLMLPTLPSLGGSKSSNYNNDNNNDDDDDDDNDDGRSGLLRHGTSTPAGTTRDIEDGGNNFENDFDICCSDDDGIFRFSFEDTVRQIRSSSSIQQRQPQSQIPRDGTYKVVYTAIVFGKPVRSEGLLELKFKWDDRRGSGGWNIEGVSLFGRSSSQISIQDGYLNCGGQMYWIVPIVVKPPSTATDVVDDDPPAAGAVAVVYRGVLDFDQCCLTDGEFQSINENNNRSSNKTKGRIARLEWVKETSMGHHDAKTATGNHHTVGSTHVDDRVEMEMTELRLV